MKVKVIIKIVWFALAFFLLEIKSCQSYYKLIELSKQRQKRMIYFIRHGQSLYNLADKALEVKHEQIGDEFYRSEEYLAQKFAQKYYDVELTETGIEQATSARKEVENIHFDLILVSPLRRALHTCDIIFNGHKSKAPILVEPAFRQILESANDLGTKVKESEKIFKHFNFQNVKDQAWYVETIQDGKVREQIKQKLKNLVGVQRSKKAAELTLNFMRQNWQERLDNSEKSEQIKEKVLPCLTKQGQILKELLKTYKSIAVVAHSECIRKYAGYKIKNCQVFPYEGHKL